MPSRQGAPGGTGFLFGNIDQRGRLDAEYLDEEAKDNIDNVQSAVKNNNLYQIEATPKHPIPTKPKTTTATVASDDDDEDYDAPSAPVPHARDAQDFADIPSPAPDDDGLDDEERADMARRALSSSARAAPQPDEENYDDDDDDDDDDNDDDDDRKPNKSSSTKPSATISATVRPPAPPSSSPVAPSSDHAAEDPTALAAQRELLNRARVASATIDMTADTPPGSPMAGASSSSNGLLLFSDMLMFSPPRLRFRRRKTRVFGLHSLPTQPTPSTAYDETARLFQHTAPPAADPIGAAVVADADARAARFPDRAPLPPRVPRVVRDEEYLAAAAPLAGDTQDDVDGADDMGETNEPAAMFQQVPWESEIVWGADALAGDGAAEEEEEEDDGDDWQDVVPYKPPPTGRKDIENGGDDDDDDDDDDEFEDAVVVNSVQSEQPPVAAAAAADDSDDDMEWEDGDAAPNKTDDPASAPTQLSQPLSSQPTEGVSQNMANGEVAREPGHDMTDKSAEKAGGPTANGGIGPTASSKAAMTTEKATGTGNVPPPLMPSSSTLPEGCELVKSILAPNRELENGQWVRGIVWDSSSEREGESESTTADPRSGDRSDVTEVRECFDHLILDMGDKNMCFEEEDSDDEDVAERLAVKATDSSPSVEQMKEVLSASGTSVHQTLQSDSLNISNDLYYANGASHNLKIDRSSIMRGLQNAPPAIKCQTTPSAMTDSELLSFHRPKLTRDRLSDKMTLNPVRRRRPRAGMSQIAGQMPKRKSDLLASEKDAYRVSLFEYALERQPCLLPVPGMASRLCTYARKESAVAVANAVKQAAGTPDADTIFMCPDEAPPLAAGNIEVGDKKLSVLESHLFVSPCVKHDAPTTDFLMVRHGKHMYVREIDSVMSLGITEPKFEVMAPNTERYKKYSRERMVLWVMREFQRMRKEIQKKVKKGNKDDAEMKPLRDPPYIEKDEIFNEFPRRRTYPETGLIRALKEMSRFHNGKYLVAEEVAKNYGPREAELLRVITPLETSAFESMESGWEQIMERGILNFTHPSGQGNILAAAEADRSGLQAGPAVGKYIKSLLLKSPWYRSQNIVAAHRLQRKDLLHALALARIVNDLKEGGTAMEERLMTLSPTDMHNVLTQAFRYNSKKIPTSLEARRSLVRDLSQRKGKGAPSADVSDYPTIIRNVLKKHRDAGHSKGAAIAAMGTSMAGGTFLGIPLDTQRRALEDGDVDDLPAEEDDFEVDEETEALMAARDVAFGKMPKRKESQSAILKKNKKPTKPTPAPAPDAPVPKPKSISSGPARVERSLTAPTPAKPPPAPLSSTPRKKHEKGSDMPSKDKESGEPDESRKKRKVKKLKLTRRVPDANGTLKPVVTYVTDPAEIDRLLNKKNNNKASSSSRKEGGDEPSAGGGLKIAIDLRRLQGGIKKKKSTSGTEKVKAKKKSTPKSGENLSVVQPVKKHGEKGQIGKIKINTKHLQQDKEQAALKRKRAQYGEDIDYQTKKSAKTSRRKRNGKVELNNILEKVENIVRETEGYLVPNAKTLTVARLKDGESPPPGIPATNLANPKQTGLDFTAPVDTKLVPTYKQFVKKPMYLNLIRTNCKQVKYESASEFLDHMRLMVDNAKAFNSSPDVQWVVQHAQLLLEVAIEQVSRRVDELTAAEEMIKIEKMEAKVSNGAGPSKKSKPKNKVKSKGKGSDSKGSDKKKKKPNKDAVITIPDGATDGAWSSAPGASTADVIDLENGAPLDFVPPLDSTPPPLHLPGTMDAGMTEDIYAIDGPSDRDGAAQQNSDQLVLDLDDMGGGDGLVLGGDGI